jgi:short-subunit dehydrogenase
MILVTGASEGLGWACARALLARTESEVLITGRGAAKLDAARDALAPAEREHLRTLASDQSRRTDVDALVAFLADPRTDVEGAILGVGVNPMYGEGPRRLDRLSAFTVEETIRTNCTHALLLTTVLLRRLRERGGGALVWIGSQGAAAGLPGAGVYCATKAFLSGLARAAHNEYAGRGVRVHLAHPGLMRTPRTAAVADRFAAAHGIAVGDVDEIAGRLVTLFLSADAECVEVNL